MGCAKAEERRFEAGTGDGAGVGFADDEVPVRVAGWSAAVDGDRLLLLEPERFRFCALSTSAALVYTSIDGVASVAQIVSDIVADVDAPVDAVAAGVASALVTLRAEGLVVASGEDVSGSDLASPMRAGSRAEVWDAVRRERLGSCEEAEVFGPLEMGAAVATVRVGDATLADRLRGAMALLPVAEGSRPVDRELVVVARGGTSERFGVYLDGRPLAARCSADYAVELVLNACNQVACSDPPDRLRFHAGVVERDGKAVLICGASGRGKSTLTAALVKAGWGYLSDEVGVVAFDTGVVWPYPKWIDLNADSVALLGLPDDASVGSSEFEHHLPPGVVGAVSPDGAVVVAVVLLDTGSPTTSDELLLDVLPQVFPETWEHPDAFQQLVSLSERVVVARVSRAPVDEMVAEVEAVVASAASGV